MSWDENFKFVGHHILNMRRNCQFMVAFSEKMRPNIKSDKVTYFPLPVIKHPTTQLRYRKPSRNEDSRMETYKLNSTKGRTCNRDLHTAQTCEENGVSSGSSKLET